MSNKYVTAHLVTSILSMFIGGCAFVFNSNVGDAFSIVVVFFMAIFCWVASILVLVLMKNYFIKKGLSYFCPILPCFIFFICSILVAKEKRMLLYFIGGISIIVNIAFFIIDVKRNTVK